MAWTEGQATPDGCTVITPEDVSAASGFEIVETMPMLSGEPGCAYHDADGMVLSTRFHQLSTTGQAHLDAELALAPLDVPGVGDRAIWIERVWQLWVKEGDMLVMLGIGRIGETPARLELAKTLGPLVVQRFE